jgi:phage shock protein PspC (stress-responsive transcriptional regulator)
MNKTVTINLSGIVFHIDENAYELLKRYLERLKAHFSNTQGNEEIIADIESRMAEMFTEKNADTNRVIMVSDVNELIEAMGKPEDLPGNEEEVRTESPKSDQTIYYESTKKRFYRNPDDKVLGGVCSGISAYFDIDPIWLRLAFGLSIIFAGTGVLIYLILWFIIPEAKSTSDKLQMKGERVNVATIEKNVREELESLKKRGEAFTSDITSEENKRRMRTSAQKVGDFIGDILRAFGKFIAAIFGIVITIASIGVLIALTVAIFSGVGVFKFAIPHTVTHMVLTNSQLGWLILGGILAIGIPFTLLLLNGLKILFKVKLNLRMIGAVMAGLWLVGIGICVMSGIRIASEFERSATIKSSRVIPSTTSNVVYLKALKGTDDDTRDNFLQMGDLFILDEDADSVMNRSVRIDIEQSDDDSTYIITTANSRGKTYDEAKNLSNGIGYNYRVSDSLVVLPDYFQIGTNSKYRGQNLRVVIKLPVGKSIMLDNSLRGMLDNVANVSDTWDWEMVGHEWTMKKEGLTCNNCPENSDKEEMRHKDTTIRIDSNGVQIQTL